MYSYPESRQAKMWFGSLLQRKEAQGPVVQSIVSLTGSLVVKLLSVLVSTISNSQIVLLKNCAKATHIFFFSKNISVRIYAIFNDQNFNNNVKFELTTSLSLNKWALIRSLRHCTVSLTSHVLHPASPPCYFVNWENLSSVSRSLKSFQKSRESNYILCFGENADNSENKMRQLSSRGGGGGGGGAGVT